SGLLHEKSLALEVALVAAAGLGQQGRRDVDAAARAIATEGGDKVAVAVVGVLAAAALQPAEGGVNGRTYCPEVPGPCVVDVATAVSAAESAGGSVLPRLSARRSIPAHAVPLKKNRG